jgi:hypothetical protein
MTFLISHFLFLIYLKLLMLEIGNVKCEIYEECPRSRSFKGSY